MPRKIDLTQAALREFHKQIGYLDLHAGATVSRRFTEAVFSTLDLLALMPEIGTVFVSNNVHLKDVRFHSVKKPFHKYSIYYRALASELEILHIIHGARNLDALLGK